VTAAVLGAFATPTFAATMYYVGQNAKTHKCTVSTHKPDGAKIVMIGTSGYNSKADASAALKADSRCE